MNSLLYTCSGTIINLAPQQVLTLLSAYHCTSLDISLGSILFKCLLSASDMLYSLGLVTSVLYQNFKVCAIFLNMPLDFFKDWFKATIPLAHVGSGNIVDGIVYIYAKDLMEARHILLTRVRGWKRNHPYDLEMVDKEDYDGILDLIKAAGLHSFNVKAKGYFYVRRK